MRTWLLRCISAVLLVALSATARAATATDLLSLDVTDIEIVQKKAGEADAEFTIPLRYGASDVEIKAYSIFHGGHSIDVKALRPSLEKGAPSYGTLRGKLDLKQFAEQGSYAVTLTVEGTPTASVTEAPTTPAEGAGGTSSGGSNSTGTTQSAGTAEKTTQVIKLTLTRPAAELQAQQPLQVQRIVYLPYVSILEPEAFTLDERKGKSALQIAPEEMTVDLFGADPSNKQGELKVHLPANIDAYSQKSVSLEYNGSGPVGISNGKLQVHAPQLVDGSTELSFQVKTRITLWWLLVVVVVGILLGAFLRDRLQKQQVRLQAEVIAAEERLRVTRLIDREVDADLKAALEGVRNDLDVAVNKASSTPEDIQKAATDAAAAVAENLKDANDRRNVLRTALEQWQMSATAANAPSNEVAGPLNEFRAAIGRLVGDVKHGEITDPESSIKNDLPRLAKSIKDSVESWNTPIEAALARIKPWPETVLAAVLQPLLDAVGAARQAISEFDAAPEKSAALAKLMVAADHIQRMLTGRLIKIAFPEIWEAAVSQEKILSSLKLPDAEMSALRAQIAAAEQIQPSPENLPELVALLNGLWRALAAAIAAGWSDESSEIPAGLAEGRFEAAVQSLKRKQSTLKEQLLGQAPGTIQSERFVAENMQVSDARGGLPDVDPARPWTIVLEEVSGAQPVTIRARVVTANPADRPELQVTWFVGGALFNQGSWSRQDETIQLAQVDIAEVRAVATDRNGATVQSRLTIRAAGSSAGLPVADLRRELNAINQATWWMSAVIITAVGFFMFSPTFVGTLPEIVTAFLWGFTVDVGTAKMLELARRP